MRTRHINYLKLCAKFQSIFLNFVSFGHTLHPFKSISMANTIKYQLKENECEPKKKCRSRKNTLVKRYPYEIETGLDWAGKKNRLAINHKTHINYQNYPLFMATFNWRRKEHISYDSCTLSRLPYSQSHHPRWESWRERKLQWHF